MAAQGENGITVAIIGGGIGGLSCAYGLLKKGIDVHVYESAVSLRNVLPARSSPCSPSWLSVSSATSLNLPRVSHPAKDPLYWGSYSLSARNSPLQVGAGISIGRNAQNAYKELGFYDEFRKIADTTESGLYFQYRGAADNGVYAEVSTSLHSRLLEAKG